MGLAPDGLRLALPPLGTLQLLLHTHPRKVEHREEREPCDKPVSYTHLTLPTNREV